MNAPTQPSGTAPDKPQFAVWPYLNPYLRGGQELPRAKCYDGRESWELLSQESPADRGQPFRTEEQVLDWRQGTVVHAEPERVAVYVRGSEEGLCRARSLTDEFAQQFTPTSQPNVYQSGWRTGQTNAILRLNYCPYYGPVVYLSEAAGPNSTCTLRRFWPYKRIETPTFEIADLIDKEFDNIDRGVINDPQCCLGDDWGFLRIEQVANGMQGHQFEGLRFQSYQQRIAAAAYDLDEALSTVHGDVPASARACFWKSLEVHRHLIGFVRRLIAYAATLPRKAKTRLDDPQDAFLCAQTQIATFARVLAQTRPPAADRNAVACTTKPAEPKSQTGTERLDERAAIDESTQEEQIGCIGISSTTYYSFRRGNNVSNITLGKIAAYLGCDVADLKTQ
jgi:hypothetical protein